MRGAGVGRSACFLRPTRCSPRSLAAVISMMISARLVNQQVQDAAGQHGRAADAQDSKNSAAGRAAASRGGWCSSTVSYASPLKEKHMNAGSRRISRASRMPRKLYRHDSSTRGRGIWPCSAPLFSPFQASQFAVVSPSSAVPAASSASDDLPLSPLCWRRPSPTRSTS